MGAISVVTLCGEALIVIVCKALARNVSISFYVTTFIELFLVTWITLYGLNKVRKGTTLFRTLFCLISMFFLLWVSYTVMKAGIQAGISKLNLDILNPSWDSLKKNIPIVVVGQIGTFISTVGWGLTDVDVDIFNVV